MVYILLNIGEIKKFTERKMNEVLVNIVKYVKTRESIIFYDMYYTEMHKIHILDVACEYDNIIIIQSIYNDIGNDDIIHTIVQLSSLETIKYFVEQIGIDKNNVNDRGHNMFISACLRNRDIAVIKYIVKDLRVDPHKLTKCNNIGLFFVRRFDVFKYLIEIIGIRYDHTNMFGDNVLSFACENCCMNIVKYCIDNLHLDPNRVNNDGENLLWAISDWKSPIAHYLLDKVDVTKKNNNGENILFALDPYIDTLKYFLDKGLDINIVNNFGKNVLMRYCEYVDDVDYIKYVLENINYDINYVDYIGDNCLTILINENFFNEKIVEYLLFNGAHIQLSQMTSSKNVKLLCELLDKINVNKITCDILSPTLLSHVKQNMYITDINITNEKEMTISIETNKRVKKESKIMINKMMPFCSNLVDIINSYLWKEI